VFSIAALDASVVTLGLIVLLPAVFKGADGWSRWRKTRFALTAIVYGACGALLFGWALEPWNP